MTESVIERIEKNQFEIEVSESIIEKVERFVNVLKKSPNFLPYNEDVNQFLFSHIDDKELLCSRSNR